MRRFRIAPNQMSGLSVVLILRWLISLAILFPMALMAHQVTFNSLMTYTNVQPTGDTGSVSNWMGAAFDAGNIGGSGVNANGAPNNGTANDAYTYVANNQPVQGQTFLTGGNANGYQLNAITVRMAGYTANNASGANNVYWNLLEQNGPIILTLCEINGTNRTIKTMQNFKAGDVGSPGSGNSANGAGTYITFHLPFTTYLNSNTTYGFELQIGNGGANYFEWLGTSDTNAYPNGTAYQPGWTTITPTSGDHVFMADMTALGSAPTAFVHPGTLHTQADLDLMKAKVLANAEPWKSGYNVLISSPYAQTNWSPAPVVTIIRTGVAGDQWMNNYTRSQQDAQAIYNLALRWHVTGDTNYAQRAVYIANAWSSTLQGVNGDSNAALGYGLCGYLFAIGGELLSTYPDWAPADLQAYKNMMMRVFYPACANYLWWHYDTFWREGGNTHYRLNWDSANMAAVATIGILCDNRAVYEQALDFFKCGPGNSRVERAAWYLHPGGLGQGEEAGRDQAHNLGGWHCMALLCQSAWNQGDDLFGYDNNRVLRAFEYNAKFNLWNDDVAYARHRNSALGYTEGSVSWAQRGIGQYYHYELVYNHYVNVKGIAAPWSQQAATATRPEPWPNIGNHPSHVDWLGLGTLTYSQVATTNDVAPTGLRANWSKNKIILDWWGSARATNYLVKKASTVGGPYSQIGTVSGPDLNFADTNAVNNTTNYYIITAATPSGNLDSTPLRMAQELVTRYTFEGNVNDVVGTQNAERKGGSTGLPGYAAGFGGGQSIDLDGVDDYVQLPVGAANFQDITIAAWVQWDGGGNWQRVFDFGSEIEKTMFLTPKNGGGVIEWSFTTTKGGNFYGDASYALTGPAMPVGVWTHLAVTLNGDAMTLYVNGVPVDTEVNDLIDPLYGQPFCYLGKSMYNTDPLFNGRIDDFRIYSHALSGADVYNLWGQSANHPPVFTADPIEQIATEDVAFSGSVSATDLDGGGLTYSKLTGPAWLTVASNGALSGTPANADVGQNYFVVRVADPSGATDDATLWINVTNVNDPPTWTTNPIDGGTNLQGIAYSFSVGGLVNDVDGGDALTISKVSGPAWLAVSTNGLLSGTPGAGDVGTNSFTLRVTDLVGAYNEALFKVVVLPGTTLAYWNFEEGTTNTPVTGPAVDGNYSGTIRDISGNNYHASPFFNNNANIKWTVDVPAVATPQTGATNKISLGNTGTSFFSVSTTGKGQSPDPNLALNTWTPTNWTIEATFRLVGFVNAQGGGNKTIVGRDGNSSAESPLYFGTVGNQVVINYQEVSGIRRRVLSTTANLATNKWYALAATSDGSTLSLYLKDITGGASNYTLMGTSNLIGSANPALAIGTGIDTNYLGNFSIGRGFYNNAHVDRIVNGDRIDDVRLSSVALSPGQFLYSTPPAPAAPMGLSAMGGDSEVSLSWNSVSGVTGYKIYRSLTNGGPYSLVDSPANTNHTDIGLINGTAYYYVVSAVGIGGESTNSLPVVGRPVSLATPQMAITSSTSQIEIDWPFEHTGWRLQTQTNSLGTNWVTVMGSANTNTVMIPIGGAAPISVFFRLVYP